MRNNFPEYRELFKQKGLTKSSLIQAKTYPLLHAGEDVIGLAATGTGKTFAYGLPLIQKTSAGVANSLVILEPTTELAVQTRDALMPFISASALKNFAVVGSGNRNRQMEVLKKRQPEVIIATPGRFFDMLAAKRLKVENIQALVLDEFDDLLASDQGQLLTDLSELLPKDAQVALFGATDNNLSASTIAKQFNRDFKVVDVRDEDSSQVAHDFVVVDNAHKVDVLRELVQLPKFFGIVFFNTDAQLEKTASIIAHTSLHFSVLTSRASKQTRQQAVRDLDAKKIHLLLATDLAARGLDFKDLTYVINFTLPIDEESYIHRAGRTGRMGKTGTVISLGTDHDRRDFAKIISVPLQKKYLSDRQLVDHRPHRTKQVHHEEATQIVKKTTVKKKRKKQNKNKGYHPHHLK